jgi:hypothetical protein
MGRNKGSGLLGPTRSTRLPRALDEWFIKRLSLTPEKSVSELLVALIHGGLRLRDGYMAIHRRVLEYYVRNNEAEAYSIYRRSLADTFGDDYVDHVERWLAADGLRPPISSTIGSAILE